MRDHISKRHLSAISVTTIKYLFSQQMPEEHLSAARILQFVLPLMLEVVLCSDKGTSDTIHHKTPVSFMPRANIRQWRQLHFYQYLITFNCLWHLTYKWKT